jgi:dTDP-4-amino-4,6-dideoxygalactose transaminase
MIKKHPALSNQFLKNHYFFAKGRVAFSHALDILDFCGNEKILLPAYIGINDREGSGVFDPISSAKIPFGFYKIHRDLSVDFNDLKDKIQKNSVKAVLLIHYFGFPQPGLIEIIQYCKARNIAVIEDCAHAYLSTFQGSRLGYFGDMGFYSLHKIYPVPDGGLLVVNNPGMRNAPGHEYAKISQESLELFFRFDNDRIAEKRVHNYSLLLQKIRHMKGISVVHPFVPEGVVPLNFPMIVTSVKKNRQDLYFALQNEGIEAVSLYHRIIDEIDRKKYPDSAYLSDNIISLPIHQEISDNDIDIMASTVEHILEE